MQKRKGFTLIELLVVIAIIALLMAILMPALARVKRQAQTIACQMNLKQFVLFFVMYGEENDSRMPDVYTDEQKGQWGAWTWMVKLYPYWKSEPKIWLCPIAKKIRPGEAGALDTSRGAKHTAWQYPDLYFNPSYPPNKYLSGLCGSYGLNCWLLDPTIKQRIPVWNYLPDAPFFGGTVNLRHLGEIPLMADSYWPANTFMDDGEPPFCDGEHGYTWDTTTKNFCMDRHDGGVNVAFMDSSVRKAGIKELWMLRWNRVFDKENIYTIAGHSGNEAACAAVWDEAAPWAKKYPEY